MDSYDSETRRILQHFFEIYKISIPLHLWSRSGKNPGKPPRGPQWKIQTAKYKYLQAYEYHEAKRDTQNPTEKRESEKRGNWGNQERGDGRGMADVWNQLTTAE